LRPYPRTRQVDESLKELLAEIIERQVTDPRLEFVTVTGVSVSRDMRYATVFVTAHGGADRYAEMLAGFESARGRIRALLGERIRMKFVPELTFALDESVDEGARIDNALRVETAKEGRLADLRREVHASDRTDDDSTGSGAAAGVPAGGEA
jgi:ribosome-binding factor A